MRFSGLFAIVAVIAGARAYTGQATYYEPGLGACGEYNTASDSVVAVSQAFYNGYPGATPNPNNNPICNRKVQINYQGKSAQATIVDHCPGCGYYDLDLSPAVFEKFAALSVGVLQGVEWDIL